MKIPALWRVVSSDVDLSRVPLRAVLIVAARRSGKVLIVNLF